jgi:hypothetical protein
MIPDRCADDGIGIDQNDAGIGDAGLGARGGISVATSMPVKPAPTTTTVARPGDGACLRVPRDGRSA